MMSFEVSELQVEQLRTGLGLTFKATCWHPTRCCEWNAFEKGAKAPDFFGARSKAVAQVFSLTAFTFPKAAFGDCVK